MNRRGKRFFLTIGEWLEQQSIMKIHSGMANNFLSVSNDHYQMSMVPTGMDDFFLKPDRENREDTETNIFTNIHKIIEFQGNR